MNNQVGKEKGKVVAIQIAPFKRVPASDSTLSNVKIETEIQLYGADIETAGYGIYKRFENGTTEFVEDKKFESEAILAARPLTVEHDVPLEPYGWQSGWFGIICVKP